MRAEAGFELPATTAEAVGVPTAEAEAAAEAAAAALAVLDAHIDHLGMVASLMTEWYAPFAPAAIRAHACIRSYQVSRQHHARREIRDIRWGQRGNRPDDRVSRGRRVACVRGRGIARPLAETRTAGVPIMATVTAKFQVRRDTAAAWTAADPILASGEFGFEIRHRKTEDRQWFVHLVGAGIPVLKGICA